MRVVGEVGPMLVPECFVVRCAPHQQQYHVTRLLRSTCTDHITKNQIGGLACRFIEVSGATMTVDGLVRS